MGAPQDVVARISGEEAEDDAEAIEQDVIDVEVLAENWNAVQVFLQCESNWIGGMGAYRLGIAAQEIRAAVGLMRIPRAEWPDILEGVRYMGRVAAEVQNAKG